MKDIQDWYNSLSNQYTIKLWISFECNEDYKEKTYSDFITFRYKKYVQNNRNKKLKELLK